MACTQLLCTQPTLSLKPGLLPIQVYDAQVTSSLLNLPYELKLHIIDHLDRRRDLYNLSLTCHAFEELTFTTLYRNVDVQIPQPKALRRTPEGLPTFRWQVINSLHNLSLRTGRVETKLPAFLLDDYIFNILAHIPEQQLTSFSHFLKSALPLRTLELLMSNQGTSIRSLSCYELEHFSTDGISVPVGLRSFECRSVREGQVVQKVLQANSQTVEILRLGQETELVEQYKLWRTEFWQQITQPDDLFSLVGKIQGLPNLRELALVGIDVGILVPNSVSDALFFCQLESLTLESCGGSAEFLNSLAGTFRYGQSATDPSVRIEPRLKQFFFRHEAPSSALTDSLMNFLASFNGLSTLSILLENTTFLERPPRLINKHGPTLETLVLECRIQPRQSLSLDTSRPFGIGGYDQQLWEQATRDICDLCPNLVELGIGFPWDDETVRTRPTLLPTLPHLRTVHVRNFPQRPALSQMGDYAVKEQAQKWLDWVFLSPAAASDHHHHPPALETLSIGPTLHESRWNHLANPSRPPPEFSRTHHFCLDWAKTRFGRWSALVTPVGERYMEELRAQRPLDGAFRQVWLM